MRLPAVLLLIAAPFLQSGDSAFRMVEYDIDGNVSYVNATYTNKDGGTEQRELRLPYHDSFIARIGSMAYMSAQKPRSWGFVHVTVHVGPRKFEASSDVAYGIATAKARVE